MASIITNLVSGGLLDGVSKVINSIRGKSPEDAAKLAELTAKYQSDILAADLQMQQAQVDVNKIEAANTSMFVAGWRPAIGWCCGIGLFVQFLVRPIFIWATTLRGHTVDFPELDMGTLMTLLLGMLGLGGMRTFEKVNGIKSGH